MAREFICKCGEKFDNFFTFLNHRAQCEACKKADEPKEDKSPRNHVGRERRSAGFEARQANNPLVNRRARPHHAPTEKSENNQ